MSKLQCFVYPAVAALSLAAAFAAHAQSSEGADYDFASSRAAATTSTVARAQVRAEVAQARAERAPNIYAVNYNPLILSKSVKTREEVQAEVRALRGTNYAQAWYGEDSGSFVMSQQRPATHATPVLAAKPARSSVGQ